MDFKTKNHKLNIIIDDIVSNSETNIVFNNFIDEIINKYKIIDPNIIEYLNLFKYYYMLFIINFTLPNMIIRLNLFNLDDNFYKKYGESETRLAVLILNSKIIVYHKMLITKLNLDKKKMYIDEISNAVQDSSCWDKLYGETDVNKINRVCIELLDDYITKIIHNILLIIKYKIDDKINIDTELNEYLFKYFDNNKYL